jgi:guanylate kinase
MSDAYPTHGSSPLFLVLSGPSGSGKSTLMNAFMGRRTDFVRCLSVTTRPPRGSERNGVDYHFVDEAEFMRRVASGAMLEHAQVFGKHRYGTLRSVVEGHLAAGRGVIKDMDVQGAAQVRSTFPGAVHIFVVPPTRDDIERRLRGRGTDAPEVIARRLDEADRELARWRDYDYLVVNDVVERAVGDLEAIVVAERLRIPRHRP